LQGCESFETFHIKAPHQDIEEDNASIARKSQKNRDLQLAEINNTGSGIL
jgi:hypothetical protein